MVRSTHLADTTAVGAAGGACTDDLESDNAAGAPAGAPGAFQGGDAVHHHDRRTHLALRQRVDELIAQVRAAEQAIAARALDAVHPRDGLTIAGASSRERPSAGGTTGT
jgi:hypothetical protein